MNGVINMLIYRQRYVYRRVQKVSAHSQMFSGPAKTKVVANNSVEHHTLIENYVSQRTDFGGRKRETLMKIAIGFICW